MDHTEPVFFRHNQVFPDLARGQREANIMTCLDVCKSAVKVIGNHVVGAQKIRNLWRIYTRSRDVRATLLVKGLSLRTKQIGLFDKNPYIHNIKDVNNQPKYTRITEDYLSVPQENVKL